MGNRKLIVQVLVSKAGMNSEIFILIEKQLRRVSLFDSFHRSQWIEEGYRLKHRDEVHSKQMENEPPGNISESQPISQPYVLRILSSFFFRESEGENNRHAWEIFGKMIDSTTQRNDDFSQIKTMASHPSLPLLFLANKNTLFIVSRKTLSTLTSYSDQALGKIK